MKKFVYPAVVYYDEDNKIYLMYIEELGVSGVGPTMEECNISLHDSLVNYIITSLEFGIDIPEPQNYNEVEKKNPNKKVMLVPFNVDETKLRNFT